MKQQSEENVIQKVKRVPCEVYSRIVGYLRPVQDWNEGKQQEFAERHTYGTDEVASTPTPQDEPARVKPNSAG